MSLRDRIHQSMQFHEDPSPYPLPPTLTPHRPTIDSTQPAVSMPTYHTPYLGLRARLSQVWLNRWTVLLLLILVRVLLDIKSVDNELNVAREQALSACTSVESMGSALASMPHYLAQGVNEAAAQSIEAAVHGLEKTLLLILEGVESIAVFVINMYIQTYTCLLTAAVASSLHSVIDATEDVAQFVNKTMQRIAGDIENDAKTFQSALNSFISGINDISSFLGSSKQVPTLTLPSLDELNGLEIPSSFQDELEKLNQSIPTFPEVQAVIEKYIRLPFETVITEVNNTLTVYQFNRNVFPVPEKEQLTFCSDNPTINNFFISLAHKIADVRKILIAVLVVLAVLVMIPMAFREWWSYRTLITRGHMLSQLGSDFDPVDIVYISGRPFTSTVGLKAASHVRSAKHQVLIRWFISYITTPACLFVLSLGLAGLISALGQYVVLREIEKEAPVLAAEVDHFADLVIDKLTAASVAWANGTNSAINQTTADINTNLLGWVVTSTQALNNTLNEFIDAMTTDIDAVFGGTPLEQPIEEIINCLVVLKIRGIEKGITWVHDNAHVSLPLLPMDVFSLGAAQSVGPDAQGSASFLADTGSQASDKITNIVVKLADKYRAQLLTETWVSTGVIGVWVVVVLLGLLRVVFCWFQRDKTRAEGGGGGGGAVAFTGDGRQPFSEKLHSNAASLQDEDVFQERDPGTLKHVGRGTVTSRDGGAWRQSSHGEIY